MRQHPRIIPARCTHVSGLSSPVDAAQLPPALSDVPPGASLSAFLRDFLPEQHEPAPRFLRPEEVSQPAWLPRFRGEQPPF